MTAIVFPALPAAPALLKPWRPETEAPMQSVVSVAAAVQEAVTNVLESMAGVKISAVNVNVCGIVRQ